MAEESDRQPLLGTGDASHGAPELKGIDPKANRRYWVLGSMYFLVLLAALDGTLVSALLGHIASDLQALGQIQWVTSGYLVAFCAVQPVYGKLSDLLGRRPILLFCEFLFGLGTLVSGLSTTLSWLVAGRVIQGSGAGGLMSLSAIVISDYVTMRDRALYQGIGNIVYGCGASLGGFAGGLISAKYSWQVAFLCQVPMVALSGLIIAVAISPNDQDKNGDVVVVATTEDYEAVIENSEHQPNAHPEHEIKKSSWERIDIFGCISIISALLFCMVALSIGGVQYPWSSPIVWGSLIISALFLAGFVYVESHVATEPIIPIPVLMNRSVVASSLCNMFFSMGTFGFIFFLPLYLGAVKEMTPADIGKCLIFQFVATSTCSFTCGLIMKLTGRYYWLGIFGGVTYLAGILENVFMFNPNMGMSVIATSFILGGIGNAFQITVALTGMLATVPKEIQAMATSVLFTFRGVGFTIGVSLAASMFHNVLLSQLLERLPDRPDVIEKVLDSVEYVWTLPADEKLQVVEAFQSTSHYVMGGVACMIFLGTVCIAGLKETKL